MLNGSYQIKQIDGKIFKTPTNGIMLKKYFDRNESWGHEVFKGEGSL